MLQNLKCSSSLTTIAGLGDEVLIPTEGTVEVSSPSANPVAESALSTGADYNDLGSFTTCGTHLHHRNALEDLYVDML
jgi:hypothetical protein